MAAVRSWCPCGGCWGLAVRTQHFMYLSPYWTPPLQSYSLVPTPARMPASAVQSLKVDPGA